jgi:hypothetical protein
MFSFFFFLCQQNSDGKLKKYAGKDKILLILKNALRLVLFFTLAQKLIMI